MSSKSRQSAYRRSYNKSLSYNSAVAMTPEMRKSKEAEKEKLKKCNNRLVNYIDKVNDLIAANKALKAENAALRKADKDPQQDIAELYEDELSKLRAKVEDLTVENQRLEIERDNLRYDLEETEEKLDQEQEERKALEKEVKDLRKDVDDATIERVSLETKLENLQETLQLERQAHAVELDNLRGQIQPVSAVMVENEPSSLMPDLTDAIQNVRQQYEAFNTKNMESLDAFYKDKLENLSKQLKATQEDNRGLKQENTDQRKTIHQLEMELEALRGKTDNLEKQIDDLEDRLQKQGAASDKEIHELTKELDDAKLDLAKYLKEYQDLNNLKLSLDQEIAIYHKLLQGEESRNITVETTDMKAIKTERGRSVTPRSRSSSKSKSRSRSRSSSKSRSRSRSSSRSRSDIVEELLETKAPGEQKGVVAVTWKVKGGTVHESQPFDPEDDAEKIHKGLDKFLVDDDPVVDILPRRTKAQRLAIAAAYRNKYEKELTADLKANLKDSVKSTALHLMWNRSEIDANALRKAMKGFGTDEATLIEILCTQSSREIELIKTTYATEFDRDLETDISKETSGGFRDFILAVLKADRPADNGTVVANVADADAKALLDMSVKDWDPSNDKFLEIFTERSFEHLWYLFNQSWPKVSEDDLLETIENECKGNLKKGLKTLVRFSVYIPPAYYATQLYEAMKGIGTEDNQMIYILTTRSEIDMIDIKEEFTAKFQTPLALRIKDETSGGYKKMLLKLIDEDY